jgi:hypothetical protein
MNLTESRARGKGPKAGSTRDERLFFRFVGGNCSTHEPEGQLPAPLLISKGERFFGALACGMVYGGFRHLFLFEV